MVAIVAGGGLGLEQSSARVLGARGLLGSAVQGRGADLVYVNAATGNLVIQKRDELLIGRGPDVDSVRTYNSLGEFTDDNEDNWTLSAQRSAALTAGALNAAGSKVTLTGWDGSLTVFDYDAASGKYVSTAGDGAYDAIVFMATSTIAGVPNNSWVWTDGSTQAIDAFDGTNGKIVKSLDPDGNALSYSYGANGFVSQITTANGESTFYDYIGNNLTQIRTVYGAQTLTRVRYGYDASNRLTSVTVDLSPEDNNIADGATYVTTYAYDGTSKRVASIAQTDGSSLQILYDASGRVRELRQLAATGVMRVTTFTYDSVAKTTTIADALGQATILHYDDPDAPDQLTRIVAPAVGGVAQTVRYDYNTRGDVISATDAANNTTIFEYDASGNLILQRDSLGNTITRTYGAKNELLTETHYAVPDSGGVSPPPPPPPPPAGLIAAYGFNEGSGAVANNSVSGNYNGTFSGTPTWASGQYGGALSFDGSDVVDLGNIPEINGASAVTIEAWIKRGAPNARVLLGKENSAETHSLLIDFWDDGKLWVGAGNGGGGYASVALNDTAWHHVALVFDGSQSGNAGRLKVYVDGVQKTLTFSGTVGATTTTNTTPFLLGQLQSNYSNGLIDDVRIYNRALTPAEVQADMAAPIGSSPPPPPPPTTGASSPLTTRYVYDAENHLRFVVSAEGRVIEYKYNASGQQIAAIAYAALAYDLSGLNPASALTESALTTWVNGISDKSGSLRTDTTYDGRGNVDLVTRYGMVNSDGTVSGTDPENVKVKYIYDQAGQLIQRIPTGSGPSDIFVYDGLGRLKLSTDLNMASTSLVFDDANLKTKITLTNGLVQTQEYNKAGDLISFTEGNGSATLSTTLYFYDSVGRLRYTEDPTGVRTHCFYDAAGRKIAEIDGDGSLTEYKHDLNNQLISTIRYKNLVSTTNLNGLVSGSISHNSTGLSAVRPAASSTEDRWEWRVYDSAGRLVETIDAQGAATIYAYDGADRLTRTVQYASLIAAATVAGFKTTAPTAIVAPTADGANDRATRYFYDADGLLIGTLDGEGAFTQHIHDMAGQKTKAIAYASSAPASLRASGTFADLLAAVTDSANPASVRAQDIHQYFLYDSRGLLRAEVNGEGGITRYRYNQYGDVDQEERGRKLDPVTLLTTPPTLASAASAPYTAGTLEVATYERSAYGQILTKTVQASPAEQTTYVYDSMRRLVSETSPDGRKVQRRYDLQGRVIGELNGEGSAALAALGANPTQTQIDDIYARWGARYVYDSVGRLISKIESNGVDAAGARTLYYYDADGNLRFVVNALGEVTEYRYNSFGERAEQIDYGTRLLSTTFATWTGGLVTTDVTSKVAEIANATKDSKRHIDYNVTGTIASSLEAVNSTTSLTTSFTYNAFGQGLTETAPTGAGATVKTTSAYDRRGLLTSTIFDSASGGLALTTTFAYDALGRALQTTDARGVVRRTSYDRAGRVIVLTDGLGATEQMTYDARGNVVERTDKRGYKTTYVYDAFNRTITTTTAEGVVATLKTNPHGQTLSIADPRGAVTTYAYDKNGALKTATRANGSLSQQTSNTYDKAGRLFEAIDERGIKTKYEYDATNRVLKQIVDSDAGGLALTTLYEYDAKGQVVRTTDPSGVVTQITYDLKGQKTTVTIDPFEAENPDGLNLATTFVYDDRGRVLTMTEGAGSANPKITEYKYDKADRLEQTMIDPGQGHLNITTKYTYDKLGNVVARTDAANKVTRYVYDSGNRLIYSVDPLGDVRKTEYDASGNVTAIIGYANPISLAAPTTLPLAISASDVTSRLTTSPADQKTSNVHDKDGRLRLTINALNYVTEFVYDGAGAVVRKTAYVNAIEPPAILSIANVQAALSEAPENDRISHAVLDGLGREAYTIDASGAVTARAFDAAGNIVKETRLFTLYSGDPTLAAIEDWANDRSAADKAQDRVTRYVYDNAGRLVYVADAEGYVRERRYDEAGRIEQDIRYAARYAVEDDDAQADVKALLLDNPSEAAISSYGYDTAGRLTDTTSPIGVVTHLDLDKLGRIKDSTVAFGHADAARTHFEYDAAGRKISETKAAGAPEQSTTSYSYDGLGRVTRITDPRGFFTDRVYDANGNLLTETVALTATANAVTTRSYDAFGNVFDKMGRLKSETFEDILGPTDVTNSYEYDARGNRTKMIEAGTRTTLYEYDKLDRLTRKLEEAVNALSFSVGASLTTTSAQVAPTEQYKYDARGNLIESVTAAGRTLFYYDRANRKIADLSAAGTLTTYVLDAAGNATAKRIYGTAMALPTTPGGAPPSPVNPTLYRETLYKYDRNNRLFETRAEGVDIGATDSNGAYSLASNQAIVETLEYDAAGNVIRKIDARGNSIFTYYDKLGRKIAQVDQDKYLTSYELDQNGNVKTETRHARQLTAPATIASPPAAPAPTPGEDRITLFTYDRDGRRRTQKRLGVAATTATADATIAFEYNGLGQVTKKTEANGDVATWTFDKFGRETRLQTASYTDHAGVNVAPRTDTEYNEYGQIKRSIVRGTNDAVETDDRITTYAYGAAGRLASIADPTDSSAISIMTPPGASCGNGMCATRRAARLSPRRPSTPTTKLVGRSGAPAERTSRPISGLSATARISSTMPMAKQSRAESMSGERKAPRKNSPNTTSSAASGAPIWATG